METIPQPSGQFSSQFNYPYQGQYQGPFQNCFPQNFMYANQPYPVPALSAHPNSFAPITQGQKIAVTDSVVNTGSIELLDFSTVSMPSTTANVNTTHSTTTSVTKPSVTTTSTYNVLTSVPSSVSSSNTQGNKSDPKPVSVSIENACLAYIRSATLRNDSQSVITMVSKNFSLDEMKVSREMLFRKTGTIAYRYAGPNEPATAQDKSTHLATSIVMKIKELDRVNNLFKINYLCTAEDLFRLMNISSVNAVNNSLEQRMSALEREMREIKSSVKPVSSQNKVNQSVWPSVGEASNRLNLIKQMSSKAAESVSSPNKRRRVEESSNNPVQQRAPIRRNDTRPQRLNTPGLRGKAPNQTDVKGAEVHEIFLFNYADASEEAVLEYFRSRGVSAKAVRYRCHPESEVKKFVMKIHKKQDFDKVVYSLPEYTGCRWYDPEHRPDPSGARPKGYFNNGRFITGPEGFRVRCSELSEDTELTTSSFRPPATPARSATAMDLTQSHPSAPNLGNTEQPGIPSSQLSVKPVVKGTEESNDSAILSEASAKLMESIKPLPNNLSFVPAVSVSNRFDAIQPPGSPSFKVGGPLSIANTNVAVGGGELSNKQ